MPHDPLQEDKLELHILTWLSERGYRLVKRNWEHCHASIDIIATRFGQLHFIGIARKSYPFNNIAETGMTRRRMLGFLQASQQYLQRNPQWKKVVIDILTVRLIGDEPGECALENNVRVC